MCYPAVAAPKKGCRRRFRWLSAYAKLHKRTHQVPEIKGFSYLAFEEHSLKPVPPEASWFLSHVRMTTESQKQTHCGTGFSLCLATDLNIENAETKPNCPRIYSFCLRRGATPASGEAPSALTVRRRASHGSALPLPVCGWRLRRSRGRGQTCKNKPTASIASGGPEARRRTSIATDHRM